MTFPSSGCQTCKARRIKVSDSQGLVKIADPQLECDEARPVCAKCKKSQRVCYRASNEQICSKIRNENPYASGQKKRPRGPRSSVEAQFPTPEIVRHPTLDDLKIQAVAYFMHDHLQPVDSTPGVLKPVSDYFLPLWTSGKGGPILDLAVSAMALAVFSRIKQHPIAAIEAGLNYQQLLQNAQVTIPTLNVENVDICLLAVFFMSRYEDAIHQPDNLMQILPFPKTLPSFSHHDGSLAILKAWKDKLSPCQPATDVIKLTRRAVIRSMLLRVKALPVWLHDGAFFGEHGLELEYDRINVRILGVRQELTSLLKYGTSSKFTSEELVSIAGKLNMEAKDIDEALQDWAALYSQHWSFQEDSSLSSHPWSTQDYCLQRSSDNLNPVCVAVWTQYCASRMLINSTRNKILNLKHPKLGDSAQEQCLECLSNIRIMANDLTYSLPSYFQRLKQLGHLEMFSDQDVININQYEDIKPYTVHTIIWPLTIASTIKDVDPTERSWFRAVLKQLGKVCGYGVLQYGDADQWLNLE